MAPSWSEIIALSLGFLVLIGVGILVWMTGVDQMALEQSWHNGALFLDD